MKFTVRIERFAGGRAINVDLVDGGGMTLFSEFVRDHCAKNLREGRGPLEPHYNQAPEWIGGPSHPQCPKIYSPELSITEDRMKDLVMAHKRDNSDSMVDYFDVNFYDHVGVDWEYKERRMLAEANAVNLRNQHGL